MTQVEPTPEDQVVLDPVVSGAGPARQAPKTSPAKAEGEPVRMAYRLLPTTQRGRLIFGAVYVVLMLVAVAIVGRGPTGSIDIEGDEIVFTQVGPDGALPVGPNLGPWSYASGTWEIDAGAAGQATEGGAAFAILSPAPGASVETEVDVMADGAGVVFRYQDPANYWGVRAVPSFGGWNIFSVVDGREEVQRVLVGQALDGTRVGVQQSGDRFRVMLNGLVRSRIDDPTLADAPGVGLTVPPGDDTARFASITVGRYDGTIAMQSGDDEEQDEIVPSLNPGGT